MSVDFIDLPGMIIDVDALTLPRASDIASAIRGGRLDFVRLLECRATGDGTEILDLEVDVERPQNIVHDIRRVERVAVFLVPDDQTYPEVISVRKNFPVVPHLNITYDENRRSFCLYEQSWDEAKARWTAPGFIERIRRWLADTAVGSLHREDQPLEQVLAGDGYRLIIPWSAIKFGADTSTRLNVVLIPSSDHRGTFIAFPVDGEEKPKKLQFVASLFVAGPRQHGIIRRAPSTLEELCDFVKSDELDLLSELRNRVREWKDDGCLDASLIIILAFPLQRGSDSPIEVTDMWAFLTTSTVFEVGKQIGIWDKVGMKVGAFIIPIETLRGAEIGLDIVRPQFSFTRVAAARASGVEPVVVKAVAVGAGALGSQAVMHLVRGGFGTWTTVDEDDLLPHNLARHALTPDFIGSSKAVALGAVISSFFDDEPPATAISANVFRPGDETEKLSASFADAQLILDFSASVHVSRHLANDVRSDGRRMSLFLSPRGTDLVCIAEDACRDFPLDGLEAQYYRAVISDPRLAGHLAMNESRTRYARTCRDVTLSVPNHLVAIHSAVAAQAVRSNHASPSASVRVWRSGATTCDVCSVDVPLFPSHRARIGTWTVVMDQGLIDRFHDLRRTRLPNETGGVLLGMFDLPRKTLYVVDTIHSPADSTEKPVLYIRGCEGLEDRVTAINTETAGEVEYIGEWHSHPDGCSCAPSVDDLNLFANITDRMTAAGYPAFMAIVGQHNQSIWFLGTMASGSGWSAPN